MKRAPLGQRVDTVIWTDFFYVLSESHPIEAPGNF